MAQQTFSISFHGPDVDDGQMDVDDFAPALIALDRLYREARRIATPDATPVKLAVHGVRDGSLVVDLNLVQIVLGGLVDMLTSDESQALTALIEYVAGAGGVLAFIKKMRGQQPEAAERIGGQVRVVTQDGEIVEAPASVFRGYESITVRHQAREVMKPLGKEGVEQIELHRESETTVSFGKDDREAFELPPGHTEEYEQETWLRVASPSFVPGHSWRLSEVDGDSTFTVKMEDANFMAQVQSHEIQFGAGDDLHCRVLVRETISEKGDVSMARSVVEVLDHRPGLQLPPHEQLSIWDKARPADEGGDEAPAGTDDEASRPPVRLRRDPRAEERRRRRIERTPWAARPHEDEAAPELHSGGPREIASGEADEDS
jgi:hypothetical protein